MFYNISKGQFDCIIFEAAVLLKRSIFKKFLTLLRQSFGINFKSKLDNSNKLYKNLAK